MVVVGSGKKRKASKQLSDLFWGDNYFRVAPVGEGAMTRKKAGVKSNIYYVGHVVQILG